MADATADGLVEARPPGSGPWPKGEGYALEPWSFATLHLAPILSDDAGAQNAKSGLPKCPAMLRAVEIPGGAVLRVGPGEVLLVGKGGVDFPAQAGFAENSLIEISHSLIGFQLFGPRAEALLALGCPLDMHHAAFPVGMVTRSVFAKFDLVLWRMAPTGFRLLVARSAYLAFLAHLDSTFPHTAM
jgi:heterotetrameric sarcosine oxidase gamma subunit